MKHRATSPVVVLAHAGIHSSAPTVCCVCKCASRNSANRQQDVNAAAIQTYGTCCTMVPRIREDDERSRRKMLTVTRNHQCKAIFARR